MRIPLIKYILLIGFCAAPDVVLAADIDITDALIRRNELFQVSEKVRPYLYDYKVRDRLDRWLRHPNNETYMVDCQMLMRPHFQSERILGPICYFLRQDNLTRRALVWPFMVRYMLEIKSALAEISTDPRFSSSDQAKAAKAAALFTSSNRAKVKACFDQAQKAKYPSSGQISFTPFSAVNRCLRDVPRSFEGGVYFSVNLAKAFRDHPGHAVTPTGWIGGNKVTYLTYNDPSEQMSKTLEKVYKQMDNYDLKGRGSLDSMLKADPKDVFTSAEGFWDIDSHPVWAQPRGIFPELLKGVRSAKKSIFIDVFFLGSSMGAALAKELVKIADRGVVKIFILRDNYNHFGHAPQMLPVFNFLKAYSINNPDKMVVSGSYIKQHRVGLPKFLDPVVSEGLLEKTGLKDHMALYGRAQSDHSKVFVIDGKTDNPVAYVGSKNLTDASGAIVYDEVAKVEGPIAAAVLDDFYFDMAYALRFESAKSYVAGVAKMGWSKSKYRSGQSIEEMVANILEPFDLLGRRADYSLSGRPKVAVPSKGNALIRTGYNNVDSSRTNCIDQDIQLIKNAKRRIFVKDQYLFDRNVVLALVEAKRRNPSIEIKAILEPVNAANPRGMPNLLYLDILRDAGIEIKWKTLVKDAHVIHQEMHMKTLSADGKYVITGSANKDQTTMYGSFREEQLDIMDAGAAKIHDDTFMDFWNDPNEVRDFSGHKFDVPGGLTRLDGKPLEPNEFIILVRNMVSLLFDATRL